MRVVPGTKRAGIKKLLKQLMFKELRVAESGVEPETSGL